MSVVVPNRNTETSAHNQKAPKPICDCGKPAGWNTINVLTGIGLWRCTDCAKKAALRDSDVAKSLDLAGVK